MSHGHGDNPYLGHHWDDMQQQFSGAKLGMWLFMAQEILFFAGLFCFYAVLRFNNPEAFDYGHQLLDKKMGAVNTVVLLLSSLTMALGVRAAQLNQKRALCLYLALTFLGGCGFMVIKGFEYNSKGKHGSLWGLAGYKQDTKLLGIPLNTSSGFSYDLAYTEGDHEDTPVERLEKPKEATTVEAPAVEPSGLVAEAARPDGSVRSVFFGTLKSVEPDDSEDDHSHGGGEHSHADEHHPHIDQWGVPPPNAHRFFSCYFGLTALHGLHVLVGMGLIAWIFLNARKGKYSSKYFTQVELVGLYWHLVDLIWIFLFPLLYLIS